MEVILQSNFPSLGYVGDRVNVANGYARNFLIPRGIAVEASSKNERQVKHIVAMIDRKKATLRSEAEELSKKFDAVTLEFKLKAGEGGKVFGAITAKDIESALKAQGFEIMRKQIRLTDTLKKAGESKVQIKLHSEVTSSITVRVGLEGQLEKKEEPKEVEGGAPKKARGRKGGKKAAAADAETDKKEEAPAAKEEDTKA